MTVVKINRLAVPEGKHEELEKRFAQRKHSVDQAPASKASSCCARSVRGSSTSW